MGIAKDFILDPQLAKDTYPIADNEQYYLGLHKNALVPWLILVPKTHEIELFNCEPAFKQSIRETLDHLSKFAQSYFHADKINIAALGNVVSQLHIHIIARKTNDFAFPDPVWGKSDFLAYTVETKKKYVNDVNSYLSTLK